ncbi:MAG: hypothetical protein ACI4SB_10105 [Acutalibacteraceae bacterium]
MNQVEINTNSILVKPNRVFLARGIFSLFLGCLVLGLLLNGSEPIAPIEITFADKLGAKICYVFLLFFFGLGFFGIIAGSMRIVIDENGVCGKRLFSKRRLLWTEIQDYGIFDSGDRDSYGKISILYFSAAELPLNKKRTKKKIRSRTVYVYVQCSGADADRIIAFCRRYSSVTPFVCDEDKAFNRR